MVPSPVLTARFRSLFSSSIYPISLRPPMHPSTLIDSPNQIVRLSYPHLPLLPLTLYPSSFPPALPSCICTTDTGQPHRITLGRSPSPPAGQARCLAKTLRSPIVSRASQAMLASSGYRPIGLPIGGHLLRRGEGRGGCFAGDCH